MHTPAAAMPMRPRVPARHSVFAGAARAGGIGAWRAAAFFLILAASAPAHSQSVETRAQAFVRDGIDKVLAVLKDRRSSKPKKLAELRAIFKGHFDHQTIGRFAAGRYFERATPVERRQYMTALENFVVNSYGRRMLKYSKQIDKRLKATDLFKITGTSPVGRRDIFVHSHINRRLLKPVRISWRLRRKKSRFMIVDVAILGFSQIVLYRDDFTSEIRRRGRGLPGLTKVLIAKTGRITQN
ncbi:MAG TPA: ABC transporter substrate-binding protein [Alphaproteobacteria bacterium]|nr:ABC transporter substrate-binding protein [Alphaproteobacteria bacterium]